MMNAPLITSALHLPPHNLKALSQGKTILILPWTFFSVGQSFGLFTDQDYAIESGAVESRAVESGGITSSLWATCESCQSIDRLDEVAKLAPCTIWDRSYLEEQFHRRGFLFLAALRVYQTSQLLEILPNPGKLFSSLRQSIFVTQSEAVLDNSCFAKQHRNLESFAPPEHPELEQLQERLAAYCLHEQAGTGGDICPQSLNALSSAQALNYDLCNLLGWSTPLKPKIRMPEWVKTISELGSRSGEIDEATKKTHYHAGTDFENIVRDSLSHLGFVVVEAHKGGAGGIDVFCSNPYALVIECKSGKGIPDNTVEALQRIAKRNLGDKYQEAQQLIIGPGSPTSQLLDSAQTSKISIMNPMTLQKLVEFNHRYPNSINPIELKDYLKPGQTDDDIEKYLETVKQEIKLRSHIVMTLKNYLQNQSLTDVSVERFCGVFDSSKPPRHLSGKDLKEILIELSSPLSGYLGRSSKPDHFYFVRDLLVDE
jgi:hypothetical protein